MGQMIGRVLGYATQVALARMYGPAQLGFYVLGFTLVQISNVFSQFGMNYGVVRFVARYRAEGDVARVRGTMLLALWTTFALSLVLSALIFFGAGLLANRVFDEAFLESVFRIFALSLPFLTVLSIALWATEGFQTVKYTTYVQEMQRPLVNFLLVLVFYLLGAQILGAVVAYVVSVATGAIAALFYLRKLFPEILDRDIKPKFETRSLIGTSAPMVVANFTSNIHGWIAVTIIAKFASASAVGIYNAATRTAAISALVLIAFKVFTPMVSDLYSRGHMDQLDGLYKDVARWTFTGGLAIFLVTVLLAKDIMMIFGPQFVSGWVVLVIISAAQLFNSSTGHTARILAMTGGQRIVMLTTVGGTVLALAITVALVPIYGILGAGLAVAASITLSNAITVVSVKRRLGLWPYNRGYLKPITAGAIAAGIAYLAKFSLSLPTGIPTVLAVMPLFLVLFAALLLAFRLSPSDRELISALWKVFLVKTRLRTRLNARS